MFIEYASGLLQRLKCNFYKTKFYTQRNTMFSLIMVSLLMLELGTFFTSIGSGIFHSICLSHLEHLSINRHFEKSHDKMIRFILTHIDAVQSETRGTQSEWKVQMCLIFKTSIFQIFGWSLRECKKRLDIRFINFIIDSLNF